MAQIYFGDLATISNGSAAFMSLIAVLGSFWFLGKRSVIGDESFNLALFGKSAHKIRRSGFEGITLLLLTLSVQFFGLLFTLSLFFLPTAITSESSKNRTSHQRISASIALLGTLLGFIFSLRFGFLPTVPLITAVLLLFGWVWNIFIKFRRLVLFARDKSAIQESFGHFSKETINET